MREAGYALWTQVHSESARGRLRSARLVSWSGQKAASATCERARADKNNKSEAGGGRGTVLVHWRGWYPCRAYPQPSEALQEQRVGASRAGQALSCANARPLRLAASQRAFFPRPPAISQRNMTNAGGSAKERLNFMAMAAGAAIAGARQCRHPPDGRCGLSTIFPFSATSTHRTGFKLHPGERASRTFFVHMFRYALTNPEQAGAGWVLPRMAEARTQDRALPPMCQ